MSRSRTHPRRWVTCAVALFVGFTVAPATALESPVVTEGDSFVTSLNIAASHPAVVATYQRLDTYFQRADVKAAVAAAPARTNPPVVHSVLASSGSATALADAYLEGLAQAIAEPARLPLTGDPLADGYINDFNAFLGHEETAAATVVLGTFLLADATRAVVAARIEALTADGRLHPESLFDFARPALDQLVVVMPMGWGAIIGSIAAIGAGLVVVACAVTVCGAAAVIAGGALAVVSGVGFLTDEFVNDTAGIAGCVIRAYIDVYPQDGHDYLVMYSTARCPETQLELVVSQSEYSNRGGTYSDLEDCSYSRVCTVATERWMHDRGDCVYTEGSFQASNGNPPTGSDFSGAYCRMGD